MTVKRTKSGKIDKRSKYYKTNGLKEPAPTAPAAPAPVHQSDPASKPTMTARQLLERIEGDTKTLRAMWGL